MKVFDLVVYAIIAFVLVVLINIIFLSIWPPASNVDIISSAIQKAQSQSLLGKTVLVSDAKYQPNEILTPSFFYEKFNKSDVLIAFECISPLICCPRQSEAANSKECKNNIEWDYNFVRFKESTRVPTNVRCINVNDMIACKVYFGSSPPQGEIKSAEYVGEEAGSVEIKVVIENTGLSQLAGGRTTMNLYKKDGNDWFITDYVSDVEEVEIIQPKEIYTLFWNLTPKNTGKYKAEFIFEAINGGFDKKSVEFDKNRNTACIADETSMDTSFNSETGQYEETHYCNGCNYSYECTMVWNNKIPTAQFYVRTKDQTYCNKSTYSGTC
jgi:hypothetical protein